jgi:hypothetical protein
MTDSHSILVVDDESESPDVVSRYAFGNWRLVGIAAFAGGFPSGVEFNTTAGANITGGGDGARVVVAADAMLPKSRQTLAEFFDTAVFARPAEGTLVKNFSICDKGTIQLRWEAYKAFNRTQWSGANAPATFNPQGQQVTSLFGQVPSARVPGITQLAIRVSV